MRICTARVCHHDDKWYKRCSSSWRGCSQLKCLCSKRILNIDHNIIRGVDGDFRIGPSITTCFVHKSVSSIYAITCVIGNSKVVWKDICGRDCISITVISCGVDCFIMFGTKLVISLCDALRSTSENRKLELFDLGLTSNGCHFQIYILRSYDGSKFPCQTCTSRIRDICGVCIRLCPVR